MTTQQVAEKLIEFCRADNNLGAINELYADNIISKEMEGAPRGVITGKEEVLKKNQEWLESVVEFHGGTISEPQISGNFFSVVMDMDVTYKEYGRMYMTEIGVYEVKDGKIVSEQFFYSMG